MRISDWSSDVCSSDLHLHGVLRGHGRSCQGERGDETSGGGQEGELLQHGTILFSSLRLGVEGRWHSAVALFSAMIDSRRIPRSEEHTSELQSLMRISYAVFCLKKEQHLRKHERISRSRPRRH